MPTPSSMAVTRVAFPREFDEDVACPCCGSRGLRIFYELRQLPAQSCLVLEDRAEATGFARADLRLGHCEACGFVTNTAFEAEAVEYSQRYEETQGFSPTFSRYARSLAERLVDRFNLAGKTVMEIGCGKGEFLTLLCEIGAGRGIGIDPAYVPSRNTSPAAGKVEVLREFFDESHGRFEPDFICCRHSLEHIGDVRGFLTMLRRSIGDRAGVEVFFDIPDAGRVIREPAFLDIYNEHCSYFTRRSASNAFRTAGFEVTETWLEYADQYLLLTARPGRTALARPEADPEMLAWVATFAERCAATIAHWREVIRRSAAKGERIVVWGSGSKAVAFLSTIGVTDEVEYVVDINPHRHGLYMPGVVQRIEGPEHVRDAPPDLVIAMNAVYLDEIGSMLDRLGVRPVIVGVD
jgi:SAM-dependent methyltransferase